MSLPGEVERFETGTVIDERYRLLRPLGEGGMGCIWLARHERLGTLVALKLLRSDLPASMVGSSAQALITEAQITARVQHPAVVSIFDSGHTPWGEPYLAMQYLEGRVLADVLRGGSIPASAAVQLMLPIVDALSVCHERGFVHRDITPGNIFLAREHGRTRTKLLDFGVAKPANERAPLLELSGTPGYMAPEQVNGEPEPDPRTDIWALCAVLYEAVAGRRAVPGHTCAELLSATLLREVAPLQEHDGTESSLWLILERGLRKDPRQRYRSMRQLHDALSAWLEERVAAQPCAASAQVAAPHEPVMQDASAPNTASRPSRDTPPRNRQGWARPRRVLQWVARREAPSTAAAACSVESTVQPARARSVPGAALLVMLMAPTLRLTK